MVRVKDNPHLDEVLRRNFAEPEPDTQPTNGANGHAREWHFPLTAFGDIELVNDQPYLVKGLLPRRGVAVVWGPPKSGKSFWTTHLAMHVALDWDYRDHRVKGGPVVYLALEGQNGFPRRLHAFADRYLHNEQNFVPFYLQRRSIDLIRDHKRLIAELKARLHDAPPKLIVIDTLNRSLVGNENDTADMSRYLQAAELVAEAFECCILVVHHCGWNEERMRGSSVLYGGAEVMLAVKRDKNGNVVVTVEDAKDLDAGEQLVSRLESVQVGNDIDGQALTSCVIVDSDQEPEMKQTRWAKIPKAAPIAAAALREAIRDLGKQPPPAEGAPPGKKGVTIDVWRGMSYRYGISKGASERSKQKAFKTGKEHLENHGQVKVTQGGWCWFTEEG